MSTMSKRELNLQEQAFAALYLQSFNATQAALEAGYAPGYARTRAWGWVSVTQCPPNKTHVRDAIQAEIEAIHGEEKIDKGWLLKRAKILADFNISKFLKISEDGSEAVYNFSKATPDDWWCIEEFAHDRSYRLAVSGEDIPADKIKIKTPSKIAALKLLGEHIDVGAFKQQVEITGQTTQVVMSADEYKRARREMINDDDC